MFLLRYNSFVPKNQNCIITKKQYNNPLLILWWALLGPFICWALLGPFWGIHLLALLDPGPWGPFICWAPGPVGAVLEPFICWALLEPFICWALLGYSFIGPYWAHLNKYSQQNHHCSQKSSYVVKRSFFDPVLTLMPTHRRRFGNQLLRNGPCTTWHIWNIHISRICPY